MSAAEKLRGLDAATPLEKYEIDLFGVLPQIVAVVEAAEAYWRAVDDTSWGPTKDWHKRHDKGEAERASRAALTALDEALGGVT